MWYEYVSKSRISKIYGREQIEKKLIFFVKDEKRLNIVVSGTMQICQCRSPQNICVIKAIWRNYVAGSDIFEK